MHENPNAPSGRWSARVGAAARLLAIAFLLAAFWSTLRWAPARAQDEDVRLDLAKVCAGEAGLVQDVDATGDCAAIVQLLIRRAELRGVSLRTMVRAYSGRHLGVEASPRPWIAGLRLDGERPAGWPATASWARHRASWLRLIEHVGDVLEGAVLDPCPGSAHWGMRSGVDWRRAQRAGWELLECDLPTRNAFWRIPRRDGA